jgi:hypothetical protein
MKLDLNSVAAKAGRRWGRMTRAGRIIVGFILFLAAYAVIVGVYNLVHTDPNARACNDMKQLGTGRAVTAAESDLLHIKLGDLDPQLALILVTTLTAEKDGNTTGLIDGVAQLYPVCKRLGHPINS